MATTTGRRRRTWRDWLGWTIVGLFFVGVGLFVVGYFTTRVPSPNSFATAQTTVITYADGKTEIGRVGQLNRIDVTLTNVPLGVRRAVLAAEDRSYYEEAGVSVHGIARALYANVRGGEISQGGSTITQQYAKNAFLSQERTLSRKVREIFIAIKLDRTQTKDQILEDYLNTIYFGRGAYGIQTAAEAYFSQPVERLDIAQGALLAAVIRAPGLYDPRTHRAAAQARWRYVIEGMVGQGWLAQSDADALRFPTVAPPRRENSLGGPNGYLVEAVKQELAANGFDEDRLAAGGYRVVTTIDPAMQRAAVRAEDKMLGDRGDKGPVSGLAAVQPGTGRILAMYGGRDYTGRQPAAQINLAMNRRPAGSSFKPYTLATALSAGISLRTEFRGISPLQVPGWGSKGNLVRNDSGEQCPRCDLVRATADSVNTVFAQLVTAVGPENVRLTAKAAGVRAELSDNGYVAPSITLGVYGVSPLDQADGFATFSAGGKHVSPYLVASVLGAGGKAVYRAKPDRNQAFSADVAADATYAMTKVVQRGTGTRAQLADGRPAAGKTGTTTRNTDAWFVGYTPQLAAAVWIGNVDNKPLTNVPGYAGGIYGGQLPAEIWQRFVDEALAGKKVVEFPPPVYVGDTGAGLPPPPPPPSPTPSASPSPSPSVSPTGSPSPSGTPSPTPTPTPTPTPSPTVSSPSSSPAVRRE